MRRQISRILTDLGTFCTSNRLIGSSNGYVAVASEYRKSIRGRSGYRRDGAGEVEGKPLPVLLGSSILARAEPQFWT